MLPSHTCGRTDKVLSPVSAALCFVSCAEDLKLCQLLERVSLRHRELIVSIGTKEQSPVEVLAIGAMEGRRGVFIPLKFGFRFIREDIVLSLRSRFLDGAP